MKKLLQKMIARLPFGLQVVALDWVERLQLSKAFVIDRVARARYQPSAVVREYCDYNRKVLRRDAVSLPDLVITDCFPVPQWIMSNSIFLNVLAEKKSASIASYGFLPRAPQADALYRSFGAERHLRVALTSSQQKRRNALYRKLLPTLKTPEDLFNLHIDGVWLGLDIYETILRQGLPTVDMDAYQTRFNIYHGLRYFIYFYDLMESGRIKAVAPSHDCYLQMGTLLKTANRFKIPVFFANPYELIRSSTNHDVYAKFMAYPSYFAALGEQAQADAIAAAKEALSLRLGGTIGVDMSYQTQSAFTQGAIFRQTNSGDKLKVLVATHCFFDNPHAYSKMTYRDFYQWMEFLGGIASRTDYEWYIKPHRDFLPGTMEVLNDFVARHPQFKLINPQTTFHQLRDEGVSIALTCYGSVGHELPLLGYRVINATYNPHSAYNFNTHCYSSEQYEDVLMNLPSLPPVQDVDKIYEFYAVHYRLVKSDDMLFDSILQYEKYVGQDSSEDRAYDFFLKQADQCVTRYRHHVEAFLSSDCHYEFELRLPNWTVPPFSLSSALTRNFTAPGDRR